jgi:hypothetical protein
VRHRQKTILVILAERKNNKSVGCVPVLNAPYGLMNAIEDWEIPHFHPFVGRI